MRIVRNTAPKAVIFAMSLLLTSPAFAVEQGCDGKAFAQLIDQTAQSLRTLNRDSEQRFQDRLRAIGAKQGWTDSQMSAKAASAMDDSRLENFNSELEQLVSQLDTLSATPSSDVSCDRLSDLKDVRDRLVSVMDQKSGFILAQLEAEASKAPPSSPSIQTTAVPDKAVPPPPPPLSIKADQTGQASATPEKTSPPPVPPVIASQEQRVSPDQAPIQWRPHTSWSTDVSKAAQPVNQKATTPPSAPQPLPPLPLRPSSPPPEDRVASLPPVVVIPPVSSAPLGYTVEDIRDAGQGVFGKLSSEFASVINYAFKKYGQPNAYIIGDEGGGAFLAGLRYGEGQLYSRLSGTDAPPTHIYWQGPSVGMDVGATGSRSLFLVYNLNDARTLYKRFPGIDGSAYVAGGVGLTVFKSGNTVIVPIRTGLGLRLGASIAYLKFTEQASWNPF